MVQPSATRDHRPLENVERLIELLGAADRVLVVGSNLSAEVAFLSRRRASIFYIRLDEHSDTGQLEECCEFRNVSSAKVRLSVVFPGRRFGAIYIGASGRPLLYQQHDELQNILEPNGAIIVAGDFESASATPPNADSEDLERISRVFSSAGFIVDRLLIPDQAITKFIGFRAIASISDAEDREITKRFLSLNTDLASARAIISRLEDKIDSFGSPRRVTPTEPDLLLFSTQVQGNRIGAEGQAEITQHEVGVPETNDADLYARLTEAEAAVGRQGDEISDLRAGLLAALEGVRQRDEGAALKTSFPNMEPSPGSHEGQHADLTSQLRILEGAAIDWAVRYDELVTDLDARVLNIANLERDVDLARHEAASAGVNVRELLEQIASSKSDQEAVLRDYDVVLDELRQALVDGSLRDEAHLASISALEAQHLANNQKIECLVSTQGEAEQRLSESVMALDNERAANDALSRDAQTAKSALNESIDWTGLLESELSEYKLLEDAFRSNLARKEGEIEELSSREQSLHKRLERVSEDLQSSELLFDTQAEVLEAAQLDADMYRARTRSLEASETSLLFWISHISNVLAERSASVAELKVHLRDVNISIEARELEFASAVMEHKSSVTELELRLQEARASIADSESRFLSLVSESATRLSDLDAEFRVARMTIAEGEARFESLASVAADQTAALSDALEKLAAVRDELQAREDKVRQDAADAADLRGALSASESQVNDLEFRRGAQEAEISRLETLYAGAEFEGAQAKSLLLQINERCLKVEGDLFGERKLSDKVVSKLIEIDETSARLEQKLMTVQQELEGTKSANTRLAAICDELGKRLILQCDAFSKRTYDEAAELNTLTKAIHRSPFWAIKLAINRLKRRRKTANAR